MSQTSLRQFYTVRKRPHAEHGSVKRRKLTTDTRLDIPVLEEGAEPLSIPISQVEKVSTSHSSHTGAKDVAESKTTAAADNEQVSTSSLLPSVSQRRTRSRARAKTRKTTKVPRARQKAPPPKQLISSPTRSSTAEQPSTSVSIDHKTTSSSPPSSPALTSEDPLPTIVSSPLTWRTPPPHPTSSAPPSNPALTSEDPLPTIASSLLPQRTPPPHSTSSKLLPPPQSRRSLTERLRLAAGDAPTTSSSRGSVTSETRHPAQQLAAPSSRAEMIRNLYKLSAKELAQPTKYEERMQRRASQQTRDKAPPTQKTPQLHQFKSFVVESPTKSPRKQPAYQHFHSLAQPTVTTPPKTTIDLPLPYKYQVLSEKFRCTDTVVTMLQKRKEICTFDKLKPAVEEMTRRKYENRNLAQMKTVYPNAFIFRQEKNIPGVYDRKKYESYQLTVECNVNEDGRSEGEEKGEGNSGGFLDSSALLRRRKCFSKSLIEIVKKHHKNFLGSLDPPLEIPDDKVLRWHPSFQLDCIPDVEEAELPSPPLTECYTTAQDVLNAAQERLAPRVRQVLEGVAANAEGSKSEEPVSQQAGSSTTAEVNPALRGVSQKLLEKIQQKEASRAKAAITRDPVKEKKLEMLARLPGLCRIIRTFFVSEKKAAILWDSVVQKLSESHTSGLPSDRVEEHLDFLRESLPGWLSVVEIRKRRFVKINKNTDIRHLTARLETVQRDLMA